MMKVWAKAAAIIFVMMVVYFGFLGRTTIPTEGDSLIYHIPIAQRFINGDWLRKESFDNLHYYYPGSGEVILAGFMVLGIPLNLYNWVAWIWMVWAGFRLARAWGLSADFSWVLGVGMGMLPAVVRLIPNQTVDIWLVVFWMEIFILWLKPKDTWRWWLKVGIFSGMLVGVKYTGPYYLAVLGLFFGRKVFSVWNWKKVVVASLIAITLGGVWYIRNWVFTGGLTPLPQKTTVVGWLVGERAMPMTWRVMAYESGGTGLVLESVVSEYLIWGLMAMVAVVWRSRLAVMGWMMFWAYLVMPGDRQVVLSNMRYLFPAVAAVMLAGAKWAEEKKWLEGAAVITVATMLPVLTQLDYRPKLWIVVVGGIVGYEWWKRRVGSEKTGR